MALKVWIGGAPENAQVDTVVISDDIQPGMIIKATIGSSSITYTVPAGDSLSQVVASFVSLWNSSEIPEFAEIEAEAGLNGSFTLTMLASSAGKSFIVSFIIGSGTNEKQTITIGNNPTGGTFTLAYEGDVSAGIAPDAEASAVKTALEALPGIGADNVDVTGPAGGPWTVEFLGDLAGENASALQANGDGLTVAPEVQVIDLGNPTGGTWTVKLGVAGDPTAALDYDITAAELKTALETLDEIAVDDAAVAGDPGGPFTITFQGGFNGLNVDDLIIDGTSLTGGLADAVTITEQTAGGGGGSEQWSIYGTGDGTEGNLRINGNSPVNGGTFDIEITLNSSTLLDLDDIPYDVTPPELQALIDAELSNQALSLQKMMVVSGKNGPKLQSDSKLSDGTPMNITVPLTFGEQTTGGLTLVVDSTNLTGGNYSASHYSANDFSGDDQGYGSGGFRLTINGELSQLLADTTIDPLELQGALEEMSVIGPGNVEVEEIGNGSLLNGCGWRLKFKGELANQSTGLTISWTPASGSTHPNVTVIENWEGAAGTSEVQRISIAGSPGAGEFTIKRGNGYSQPIAYNQTAEELEDILEAVSTIGPGNVSCSGGPFPDSHIDVTFTGGLSGSDLDLLVANQGTMTVSSQGAVSATVTVVTVQSTIQHETTVASSGPNDWNTPANWDTGTVPVDGDDVLIPDGDNILYGLDQSDLTFTLRVTARETELGLPRRNENADLEYRDRFLKANFTSIVIDSNSALINVDFQDSNPTIEVLNSGAGREVNYSVQLIGENTANTATLLVLAGNVGVAKGPKEAAYFKTITQRGGQIWIGQDVGLEDIERTGGQIHADRTTIDGTLTL